MMIEWPVMLLVTACVVLLVAVLAQGLRARRARAAEMTLHADLESLRRDLLALQQDFNALCSGANGVGSHLSRVDRQLMRINERQEQFELRDGVHREYEQAARLIQRGAGIDEVMKQCHLTRAEAELLARLNDPARKPGGGMRSVA